MNETSLKHPHLVSAKFVTTIFPDQTMRVVLRVETDLPTNSFDPAYKAEEMESLASMLAEYMSENTTIEAVEVSRTTLA